MLFHVHLLLLEYIGRKSGVKDLSCLYDVHQKKDSSESTTEEKAMAVPPDYGYQFVKIPDGYYNCKATITNTTSKDVDPGASVDVILNVRGDKRLTVRSSNLRNPGLAIEIYKNPNDLPGRKESRT